MRCHGLMSLMVSVESAKNIAISTYRSNEFVPQYTKPIMIGSEGGIFFAINLRVSYLCIIFADNMTNTCNKCNDEKLVLLSDNYLGEYSEVSYICSECNTKTTNYYDTIFNFSFTLPSQVPKEKVA